MESNLTSQDLIALLGELPEVQRVPYLMFFRGYPYGEISKQLNLPLKTVRSRIDTAQEQLRQKIRSRIVKR